MLIPTRSPSGLEEGLSFFLLGLSSDVGKFIFSLLRTNQFWDPLLSWFIYDSTLEVLMPSWVHSIQWSLYLFQKLQSSWVHGGIAWISWVLNFEFRLWGLMRVYTFRIWQDMPYSSFLSLACFVFTENRSRPGEKFLHKRVGCLQFSAPTPGA